MRQVTIWETLVTEWTTQVNFMGTNVTTFLRWTTISETKVTKFVRWVTKSDFKNCFLLWWLRTRFWRTSETKQVSYSFKNSLLKAHSHETKMHAAVADCCGAANDRKSSSNFPNCTYLPHCTCLPQQHAADLHQKFTAKIQLNWQLKIENKHGRGRIVLKFTDSVTRWWNKKLPNFPQKVATYFFITVPLNEIAQQITKILGLLLWDRQSKFWSEGFVLISKRIAIDFQQINNNPCKSPLANVFISETTYDLYCNFLISLSVNQ